MATADSSGLLLRVVVDALTARHGGLATYVLGLLRGWAELAPQDELTVLLTEPFGQEIASDPLCAQHHLIVYPQKAPRVAWRIVRAESILPRFQRSADALLSTIPTIPALWRKPAVAVVHDLRHEDRPADFTVPVRLVRRFLFGAAYRRVDHLVADSNRTAEGLRARHPRTGSRISVVHLGADHIKGPSSTRRGAALAFGAKEPTLLLQAWEILLRNARYGGMQLHIVALGEPQRANLARQALHLGVTNHVVLDPYLGANRFGELMAEASAVLLPSRHEGFGLPVLEAMRQNIPVMISPDPALREIAAGHAACAASWAPEDLAVAIERALCMTNRELVAARAHADHFTWRRTAELTRAAVEIAARHHSLGS